MTSKFSEPTTRYAEDVLGGKIVAGKPVRQACQRHIDDLSKGDKRGLVWKPEAAEVRFKFFENVLHIEPEKFFKLEPFQKFKVGSLFGWHRRTGNRRFRHAYIEEGKGNGKTPLAAGIGLSGLVIDDEPAPEVYSAAVTREQASICYQDADRMVRNSPLLSDLDPRVANIYNAANYGVFRSVSSEHRGLDGKRPYIALIDEIHEHPNALVVDKISAGTKRRLNALIFEITNSGYDRHSVCWQHHEYSLKVLEGLVENDAWFAYVCALDDGDDPFNDETCWPKANPGLGSILPAQYLREQVEQAKGMPSKENIIRRLNFCQWTEQATRWLPMEAWDECGGPVDVAELAGRPCYAGLDLSTTTDVAALVLFFPPQEEGERAKVLPFFWIPEDTVAKRSARDRVPYDVWAREELVETTPGNVIDYEYIRHRIHELAEQYRIQEIAYDRWNASQIVTQLVNDGATMVPIGQGWQSMSSPSKELEKLVVGRGFDHGANPVLRWMASNVAIKQDPAGNIKPDKEKSTERIDGMVALVMAIARASVNGDVYTLNDALEEEGLLVL